MINNYWILIPAYNEQKKIALVVKELISHGHTNILVVNDGSKDNTSLEAKNAGAQVIEHIINRGQGAALQTGLSYLSENKSPECIITFDADGQHDVTDIPKFLNQDFTKIDIVLGSRFLGTQINIPIMRKIILKLGVIFTNIVSGISLTDTHNGFRAFGRKAYQEIKISQRGMEHASEIIEEIVKKKLQYKEIPVTIHYSDYSLEKGQRTVGFIKIALKVILRKLL